MTSRTGIDDRPRRSRGRTADVPGRTRGPRAFTLVELLVVMGIIGVLVAMLVPAVNRAVIAVRNGACAHRIAQIETGMASFKQDWGVLPPSDPNDDTLGTSYSGIRYGYQVLSVCLMGPEGRGWGANAQDDYTPFGSKAPSRAYGPYFQSEGVSPKGGIPDAFPSPRRPILYYRYAPQQSKYHLDHNPTGEIDEGFQSEVHFRLSTTYKPPGVGAQSSEVWYRNDYLLIAPGADRLYGYIRDTDPPTAGSAVYVENGEALCDDITNFSAR
jgi:prepilin-type N-terminal cleavage/methylation domain-containing protein